MQTWRRIGPPIVLSILLIGLAFGVWWGYKQLTKPFQLPGETCTTQQASTLSVNQVTVEVLNTGQTAGRASQVSEQLAAVGFNMKSPGNSSPVVARTTIVAADVESPEAKLVAGFFPDSVISPDGRTDGTVSVLVGDNFGGFDAEAPKEVDVPGGEICIHNAETAPATPAAAEQTQP